MSNRDIQATWHYHEGTKHPDGHLMDQWHGFDPMRQPKLLKVYSELDPIPLAVDPAPTLPALLAISTEVGPSAAGQAPSLATLAKVLYFSAGITKGLRSPWGVTLFRAAACTGALYHIELYVVCGDLPGLEAGVYHFDPRELALRRLRSGDHRRSLVDASGGEPSVADAPAIVVYTDVFWRNACKYQAREYRHAFWDSGTILANTLAVASACGMSAKVVAGFVDESVNRLLDLDTQREVAVAMVPLGHAPVNAVGNTAGNAAGPHPAIGPLALKAEPVSQDEKDFPAIREMHASSSLTSQEEAASWRGATPPTATPSPSGPLFPLQPYGGSEASQDAIEQVIIRRGSARRFAQDQIPFGHLSTILERATRGVPADFLEPGGSTLNHIYLIVNAVEGLAPGAYAFRRDRQALELLEEGNFRQDAGHLGLEQALPADASVDVFFLTDLRPALERFGNRGYRAAQLEASIVAGKMYLAAYAQRLGATGLTFYDDDVTAFFSPHAEGKSVMFLVAMGRRARRG